VRVGRSALDEDAIRLIEQHNPDVEFDWTRILKGQDAPPEPKPAAQPERRSQRPRPRDVPTPAPAPSVQASEGPAPAAPAPEPSAGSPTFDLEQAAVDLERATFDPAPAVEQALDLPAPEAASGVPSDGRSPEGPLPERLLPDDRVMEPATAAQARLGFEGLSRLRARHAEVLARISEKVTDAARRDELKSDAERLNPDTWVTDAEVTAGLESYETVFESLRTVVGRRRKKRGRPSGAAGQAPASGTQPDAEAGPNEPGEDG
jgi:hypothetical protein